VKETMRNQLRIKAFGKIQDPLALAASLLLMLAVSMGNFGPHHCPVNWLTEYSQHTPPPKNREKENNDYRKYNVFKLLPWQFASLGKIIHP